MQKPNFLYNPLLMATPIGGASFPSIANLTVDESVIVFFPINNIELDISETADVFTNSNNLLLNISETAEVEAV